MQKNERGRIDLACSINYNAELPTCLHQNKPDLVSKKARKSQIAVLKHIHIKYA